MATKKKAKKPAKKQWRKKLPDKKQLERLEHKERAKEREVVEVNLRYLVVSDDGNRVNKAIVLRTECTRKELDFLQRKEREGKLWLNHITEAK